jgi:hypothetical protein
MKADSIKGCAIKIAGIKGFERKISGRQVFGIEGTPIERFDRKGYQER